MNFFVVEIAFRFLDKEWNTWDVLDELSERQDRTAAGAELPGPIAEAPPTKSIRVRPGGILPGVRAWTGFGMITPEPLTSVFREHAADSCQFVPVRVTGGTKQSRALSFHYVHVHKVVDAVNVSRSKLDVRRNWPGESEYLSVNSKGGILALDPDRMLTGCPLFIARHSHFMVASASLVTELHKVDRKSFLFKKVLLRREDAAERKKLLAGLRREARALWKATEKDRKAKEERRAMGVDELQRRLDVNLPERARAFFSGNEAEEIREEELLIAADAVEATLSLRQETDLQWPLSYICFAADGRGGYFVLDTSRGDAADCPVLYYDHELSYVDVSWTKKPYVRNLEKAAGTLNAWLKRVAKGGSPYPRSA